MAHGEMMEAVERKVKRGGGFGTYVGRGLRRSFGMVNDGAAGCAVVGRQVAAGCLNSEFRIVKMGRTGDEGAMWTCFSPLLVRPDLWGPTVDDDSLTYWLRSFKPKVVVLLGCLNGSNPVTPTT